ncbi:MAG: hypothetical protein GY714_08055 [Desulfobacterales bacterium]|nr:hypothetical protein [Desulfobacterales bacterium]
MIAFIVQTDQGTIKSTSISAILDVFMLMKGDALLCVDDAGKRVLIENKEDNIERR